MKKTIIFLYQLYKVEWNKKSEEANVNPRLLNRMFLLVPFIWPIIAILMTSFDKEPLRISGATSLICCALFIPISYLWSMSLTFINKEIARLRKEGLSDDEIKNNEAMVLPFRVRKFTSKFLLPTALGMGIAGFIQLLGY